MLPTLQAIDRWCARYPRDLKASLSALEAAAGGSRAWLAAAVCVGEQLLLQQLKKGALMIMLGAAQVGVSGGRVFVGGLECLCMPGLVKEEGTHGHAGGSTGVWQ